MTCLLSHHLHQPGVAGQDVNHSLSLSWIESLIQTPEAPINDLEMRFFVPFAANVVEH